MSHVLIVYTAPEATDVPAIICDGAGHTVAFASDLEAADVLTEEAFDLIIACVQHPLALLRSIGKVRGETPVIAVVTHLGPEESKVLRAHGVVAIVPRPYSIMTLRRAIAESLARREVGGDRSTLVRFRTAEPGPGIKDA